MNLHIISFTQKGFSLSHKIKAAFNAENPFFQEITVDSASSFIEFHTSLCEWAKKYFKKGNCLVFVGSAGIAVRTIAPLLKEKTTDPAVIVIDEKGENVIPILSGHIGGANEAARLISEKLDARPVITTASDVNDIPAIDEFAQKNNLTINDMQKAKEYAAKALQSLSGSQKDSFPEFSISPYVKNDMLNLIPKCVVLGIGCKKGKSFEELEKFVLETLDMHKIDGRSLLKIVSIDLKKDEKAIISLSEKLKIPFETFSAEELNQIHAKVSPSAFVSKITGTDNVCERAVWAAGAKEMLIPKLSKDGMTLAAGNLDFLQ